MYHGIEALDPEKLGVFRTVREITGEQEILAGGDIQQFIETRRYMSLQGFVLFGKVVFS